MHCIFVYLYDHNFGVKKTVKICIVEDDPDIRQLTKEILEMNSPIECIKEFSSAEDFLQVAENIDADFVLMDIGLPGMSGTECVKWCTIKNYPIDFIMYTTHFDANDVFDALSAGAKGYILKGDNPDRLIEDVMEMSAGGSPMSPPISRLVANSFNQFKNVSDDLQKLTKQEWEVLKGLDQGLSYTEIASLRFVSPHTVRAQIRNIYEKLHVHSKLEAIRVLHNRKK